MVTRSDLIKAVFDAKLSPLSSGFKDFCSEFCSKHFPHASVSEVELKVKSFVKQAKDKYKAVKSHKDRLVKNNSAWFSTEIDLPTQPSPTASSATAPSAVRPSATQPSPTQQPPAKTSVARWIVH